MSYTVFYMNPSAPEPVHRIVRDLAPPDWPLLMPSPKGSFRAELASCDFIVVADQAILAEHITAAPQLKMIQHQGVGYERIDLNACRSRRIPVAITPEGTSVGVAEHTLLLILAAYKHLVKASQGVRLGRWMQWDLREVSFELNGKCLGLVGMGRIGREVAQRALAFGARVFYFDPLVPEPYGLPATRAASLQSLLAQADIVSLHVPLSPENRHLINRQTLRMMKPGAVLVNTARGGLVEEAALTEALTTGRLAFAALDVLEREPPDSDNPLLGLDNVLITPHIAAGTRDALIAKMRSVFANLVRYTRREPLLNVVPELADLA